MMLAVRRFIIPLALIMALSFFVGSTLVPAVLASQVEAEQCCDKENVPEVPVDNGECLDCDCPTCQFGIKVQADYIDSLTTTTSIFSWLISKLVPSGFIRSIDYPPELA